MNIVGATFAIFWASPGPGVAGSGFSAKHDGQFRGRDSNPSPGDPFHGHFPFLKVTHSQTFMFMCFDFSQWKRGQCHGGNGIFCFLFVLLLLVFFFNWFRCLFCFSSSVLDFVFVFSLSLWVFPCVLFLLFSLSFSSKGSYSQKQKTQYPCETRISQTIFKQSTNHNKPITNERTQNTTHSNSRA